MVLLHGLLMNDTQWDLALPHLPSGFRYLLPVLPIGGHRIPMRDDADLTMPGMVDVVADFLDALDLTDVTLVVTDWGGPLFLTDVGRDKRVARLVICPSEAFDNFPPGFPGKVTWVGTRTTGTVKMAMQQLRVGWLRERFFLFGMMAAKPIPQDIVEAWTDPGLADVRIRRDLLKYARTKFDKPDLVRATNRLADVRRRRAGAVEPQPRDAGRTCGGSGRIDRRHTTLRRRRQGADHARSTRGNRTGDRPISSRTEYADLSHLRVDIDDAPGLGDAAVDEAEDEDLVVRH